MTARLALVSDFNIELLGRYLTQGHPAAGLAVEAVPLAQALADEGKLGAVEAGGRASEAPSGTALAAAGGDGGDAVVWTRPEGVVASFAKALEFCPVPADACLAEVDAFAEAVLRFAGRRRHCLVASWAMPPGHRGYGPLDWRPGLGLAALLARMNLRLAERLAPAGNVLVLDADRWLRASAKAAAPKMWFAAKVPYANAVFQEAAADIAAALQALAGRSRRLIVVDLDNMLWGGVVGETGWKGIRLGGHDHVGEAHQAFQRALKALASRGVQLAVASKNEEAVALEAIDAHPEMVLRRSDLAGWRIDWRDKARNIVDLAAELRLGLDAVVFLDDDRAERERVRSALADVLVPEWPEDPSQYVQALWALRCFDAAALSEEDRRRGAMYEAERSRRQDLAAIGSVEDWLAGLGTTVTVEPVDPRQLVRVAQLFNKTNQLNLSTRRLSEAEIAAWGAAPGRCLLTLRVRDRFGDMGLTGILGLEAAGDEARVADFLMSCRVMGRKVEEAMLHLAVEEARRRGARRLVARYLPTERNLPTLRMLRASGLAEPEANVFVWDCGRPYPLPPAVALRPSPGRVGPA
ncbi:MAG: HAD-IIIC family phosphatase [Elusimicrobia bacterium]|nr:HAD-IIIC family phosphatase [Elusimicrobiota bacterium]